MHCNTQGVVLREAPYKEADKILTVLTSTLGKRTVKARGCRRRGSRLAASAQLLVYSDMTLFEYRDYLTMNEAESLEQFWGVRQDLELLALSSYFAQVTEAVAEEGRPQPELLSLLLNCLYALDQKKSSPELVKAAFEIRLMCLAGYEPLLEGCALCGAAQPEDGGLLLEEGVLCCRSCCGADSLRSWRPLGAGALAAFRHVVGCPSQRICAFRLEPGPMAQLSQTAEAFLLTQLDRPFSTLDFYKGLTVPAKEQA